MRNLSKCLATSVFLVMAVVSLGQGAWATPVWSAGVDLSWLIAAVEEPSVSPGNMTPIDLAAHKPRITPKATCIASCGSGSSVSCSYTSPTSCVAFDRNCPSQQGYVQCGSDPQIFCSPACPVCTDGQIQFIPTGNCCDTGNTEKDKYVCSGGQWVYQTTVCRLPFCGPPIP
jgi:hypothetical protein